MALNWAMLSEDGSKPVPLPGEKIFYSVEHCSLALDFKADGIKWKAEGTAFVTSQRIVLVRQPQLPAPADPAIASAHLRSLSVPLAQFVDTRYLIPIFGAPYYEAHVVPSPDGGLPQRRPGSGVNTGLLKVWFNEGGGMNFRDAVEEVKSRREEGATQFEALPTYEPPQEGDASVAGAQEAQLAATEGAPAHQEAESEQPSPIRTRPQRSSTLPHADDMAAARVAREAEERERDAERRSAQGQTRAGPPGSHDESTDLPPAYAA